MLLWAFSFRELSEPQGKKHSIMRWPKIMPNLCGAVRALGQSAYGRALFVRTEPLARGNTLWARANGKKAFSKANLQKVSSGLLNFILRRPQCKRFQVMSLVTGP